MNKIILIGAVLFLLTILPIYFRINNELKDYTLRALFLSWAMYLFIVVRKFAK